MEARKLAIISGFWANDGMNDEKGTRQEALDDLEGHFEDAIKLILSGKPLTKPEDHYFTEEDEKNPFLAPAIKATRAIEAPRDDEGTVGENVLDVEGYKELDQS